MILLPRFIRVSVFLPGKTVRPSLRSAAASRWRSSPESPGQQPGCVSLLIRQRNPAVSVLGGLVPGQGYPRCPLDLQSQRCCCNLLAPPPVPASTNHSPACEPSRDPIGRPAGLSVSQQPKYRNNLNPEMYISVTCGGFDPAGIKPAPRTASPALSSEARDCPGNILLHLFTLQDRMFGSVLIESTVSSHTFL